MPVAFISHPDCLLHDMGMGHPEQPDRIRVIEAAVKAQIPEIQYFPAPLATQEQLELAHDPDYVKRILQISPKDHLIPIDDDTWMMPHTLPAALRAAGAGILAVDLVMTDKVKTAFCNIRPPGHHAEKAQAMGFCFFNNLAIAVAYALSQYKLKRIAIIDFDVHHGNGTEDIFREDDRVLLCSSFQHPFYPGVGSDTVSNHILNLPLPAGTNGAIFRDEVTSLWLPKIKEFKPELIFFSAGFDAHRNDPLANLQFTAEDYRWITAEIKKLSQKFCQGRMISFLEGGYNLEALAESAVAHIEELIF